MKDRDVIPVHMLTEEIPADTASIADFRRATGDETTCGLLMQVVITELDESGEAIMSPPPGWVFEFPDTV